MVLSRRRPEVILLRGAALTALKQDSTPMTVARFITLLSQQTMEIRDIRSELQTVLLRIGFLGQTWPGSALLRPGDMP